MTTWLLESAHAALGDLVKDVVFVGGATIGLWLTDPAAPPVRPTEDVDVIIEVVTRRQYQDFEDRLRDVGFHAEGTIICRWIHDDSGLVLDAMPAEGSIFGFENQWQGAAVPHAVECKLPSGASIRAVPPAFLLATKLEAFADRGKGDLLGSPDFADVVALVDGRQELVREVRVAPPKLRDYIRDEIRALMEGDRLIDGVFAHLRADAASQQRAEDVVLPRFAQLT
jgi:hypothetical protein